MWIEYIQRRTQNSCVRPSLGQDQQLFHSPSACRNALACLHRDTIAQIKISSLNHTVQSSTTKSAGSVHIKNARIRNRGSEQKKPRCGCSLFKDAPRI